MIIPFIVLVSTANRSGDLSLINQANERFLLACNKHSVPMLRRLLHGSFELTTGILYRDFRQLKLLGVKKKDLPAFVFDSAKESQSSQIPVLMTTTVRIPITLRFSKRDNDLLLHFLNRFGMQTQVDLTKIATNLYVEEGKCASDGFTQTFWTINHHSATLQGATLMWGQVPFYDIKDDWSPWKRTITGHPE